MLLAPAPLAATVTELRSGRRSLADHLATVLARLEAVEPRLQALIPEPGRKDRLLAQAGELQARFPDPAGRPPLYGLLVGVKDIIHVAGLPTQAGSSLPAEELAGPEAAVVTALKAAGALILGKTVTTEFAFFEPGPTANPHDLGHTPGGSSSGSAAAVAAGYCPLALGSQTVGSTIRPAAFCGVVGFKPSFNRVSTAGVIPFSASLDTLGLFAQEIAGLDQAAAAVCAGWRPPAGLLGRPVLAVPEGPYLDQATAEGRAALETQTAKLNRAGYVVKRLPALPDIAAISDRHWEVAAAELAQVHAVWFARHRARYRPRTEALILKGQAIGPAEAHRARESFVDLRRRIEALMEKEGVDLWVCPAAPGPAPAGLAATGDPALNLPWTQAGLPALSLPAGRGENGLPLGLQVVARFWADERLLAWAADLERTLKGEN